MKMAIATLKGVGTYCQSRAYSVEKLSGENNEDYEKRTWRERCHYNEEGYVLIPPMQFKTSLDNACRFLSMKISGKGNSTYTKHIVSGILVTDPLVLNIKKDDVDSLPLFVPSDGQKGGTKRVHKQFPIIHEWTGDVMYHIIDDVITKDVFEAHIKRAGMSVGIGFFRPERGGYHGRYELQKLVWKNN